MASKLNTVLEGLALLEMLARPAPVLPPLTDDEAAGFLASGEYLAVKRFPCGRLAAVREFMFTFAIIADVNAEGYTRRWCFTDRMATLCALEDWEDYDDRPEGWHREVHTGERREKTGAPKGDW